MIRQEQSLKVVEAGSREDESTSCSWLNAVEGFFAKLSKQRLKRGVFRSVVDLQATINRFLDETNQMPNLTYS
jgi:hypothetical protein